MSGNFDTDNRRPMTDDSSTSARDAGGSAADVNEYSVLGPRSSEVAPAGYELDSDNRRLMTDDSSTSARDGDSTRADVDEYSVIGHRSSVSSHEHDTPHPTPHAPVSRRRMLQVLGVAPIAAAVAGAQQAPQQAPRQPPATPNQPAAGAARPASSQPKRRFFTAKEWRTVRVLSDDVIPRDERSGSASEAGVPEYIDFHMSVEETSDAARVAMRGGLAWIDRESRKRFGVGYAAARAAQRHAILDDISWPEKAKPEFAAAVAFFNTFRNHVASGFFSSAIGWQDLRYMGNSFVMQWDGCPPAALKKLGVRYET